MRAEYALYPTRIGEHEQHRLEKLELACIVRLDFNQEWGTGRRCLWNMCSLYYIVLSKRQKQAFIMNVRILRTNQSLRNVQN